MILPEMLLNAPNISLVQPTIISNEKVRPSRCAEVCAVCGDLSTGYHYEVPSCNGCKTFFRRTIVSERVFKCHKNGNCLFNKDIRCACRACRFKKCLEVGMNPKAIQCSRPTTVPNGYVSMSVSPPAENTPPITVVRGPSNEMVPLRKRAYDISTLLGIDEPSCSTDTCESQKGDITDSDSRSGYCSSSGSPRPSKIFRHSETEQLITTLLVYEGRADFLRNSDFEPSISLLDTLTKPSGLDDISKYTPRSTTVHSSDYYFDLEVTLCVEYAKAFDSFKNLSITDKCVLINETSLPMALMSIAFSCHRKGLQTVQLPDGSPVIFNEEMTSEYFTRQLLEPMRRCNVDQQGIALLKSIIFLHAESYGLSDEGRKSIEERREKYYEALNSHVFMNYGSKGPGKLCELVALSWKVFNMSAKMRDVMGKRNNLFKQVADTCAVWRR